MMSNYMSQRCPSTRKLERREWGEGTIRATAPESLFPTKHRGLPECTAHLRTANVTLVQHAAPIEPWIETYRACKVDAMEIGLVSEQEAPVLRMGAQLCNSHRAFFVCKAKAF